MTNQSQRSPISRQPHYPDKENDLASNPTQRVSPITANNFYQTDTWTYFFPKDLTMSSKRLH